MSSAVPSYTFYDVNTSAVPSYTFYDVNTSAVPSYTFYDVNPAPPTARFASTTTSSAQPQLHVTPAPPCP